VHRRLSPQYGVNIQHGAPTTAGRGEGWTPLRSSSEDQALNLLPDNDIKEAMAALPQQFRDVVYYADAEGFRL
jgi:DNA-directed RNA polymerase specialized sigma24 family protein